MGARIGLERSGLQGGEAGSRRGPARRPPGRGGVTSKSMFGGNGIFHDGVMFAMVDSEARCHLRADDTTSPAFEEAGSERFHTRMPYWEIPEAVRSDQERLEEWATKALAVARAAKKKQAAKESGVYFSVSSSLHQTTLRPSRSSISAVLTASGCSKGERCPAPGMTVVLAPGNHLGHRPGLGGRGRAHRAPRPSPAWEPQSAAAGPMRSGRSFMPSSEATIVS